MNNGGCPELCLNKLGSFECICKKGSIFDYTKLKCEVCSTNFYGVNCSNTCECGVNSLRCDPQIGCVCNPGYTGLKCDTVINACASNQINFFFFF